VSIFVFYVRVVLYGYMFRSFCWVIFRRVRYKLQSLNYYELYYIHCQILKFKLKLKLKYYTLVRRTTNYRIIR
jgi:hypothetical protein